MNIGEIEGLVNNNKWGPITLSYSFTHSNQQHWSLAIEDLHKDCDGIIIIDPNVNITLEIMFEDGEDVETALVYTDDDLRVNCIVYSTD